MVKLTHHGTALANTTVVVVIVALINMKRHFFDPSTRLVFFLISITYMSQHGRCDFEDADLSFSQASSKRATLYFSFATALQFRPATRKKKVRKKGAASILALHLCLTQNLQAQKDYEPLNSRLDYLRRSNKQKPGQFQTLVMLATTLHHLDHIHPDGGSRIPEAERYYR